MRSVAYIVGMKTAIDVQSEGGTSMLMKMDRIFDKIAYGLLLALYAVLPFSKAGANILSGLILISLLVKFCSTRELKVLSAPVMIPFLSLLGAGIISVVFSVDTGEAIKSFVSPMLKYLVVFYATATTIDSESRRCWLLRLMIVSGFIISGIGIYEYLWLSKGRITALLYNPNPAGGFLAMFTVLAISMLLGMNNWPHRLILGVVVFAGTMATLFTFSRGALLGLIAAIGVVFIASGKLWQNRKAVLVSFVVVCVVCAFLVPDKLLGRFAQIPDLQNGSNRQRIYLWRTAWHMFEDSPVVGLGPGGFKALYEDYRLPKAGRFAGAHNIYLQILAELGLLGFTAWMWLCASVVVRAAKYWLGKNKGTAWVLAMAAVLGSVTVAVHGAVDWVFLNTQAVGLTICGLSGAAAGLTTKVTTVRPLSRMGLPQNRCEDKGNEVITGCQ